MLGPAWFHRDSVQHTRPILTARSLLSLPPPFKAGWVYKGGTAEHKVRFQAPLTKALVIVRGEDGRCIAFLPTGTCLDLGSSVDDEAAGKRSSKRIEPSISTAARKALERLGVDAKRLQVSKRAKRAPPPAPNTRPPGHPPARPATRPATRPPAHPVHRWQLLFTRY